MSSNNDSIQMKHRFTGRHKLFSNRDETLKLTQKIQGMLAAGQTDALRSLLAEQYPPDLADVMSLLDDEQDRQVFQLIDLREAAEVLDEVDDRTKGEIVKATTPEQLARIVAELPSDEAVDILQTANPDVVAQVLEKTDPPRAQVIRGLLVYHKESAGGIMSTGFIAVQESTTTGEALKLFRDKPDVEPIIYVYVLDRDGALKGVVDLHGLLKVGPATPVGEFMSDANVYVHPDLDREQVARIFARYDLTALPVVEPNTSKLVGVITSDDVIDVIQREDTEDQLRIAGSDAQEMEKRSPGQIALLRLPWIMATMFIELFAGFVIHTFDQTLARVLLLASFMPIISAISGNTGLQSATIIVRGLSTGQVQLPNWQHAVLRQLKTTLILGGAAALTLGVIGTIWYGKWTFGLVVAVGMFAAVNIAGVVGTVVPLTSKRLGFDPAITSGPFETAFQDVVGISIFLGLATVLIRYLL